MKTEIFQFVRHDTADLSREPVWVRVLIDAVGEHPDTLEMCVLNAYTAVTELTVWLADSRPFHGAQSADWRSLGEDVSLALHALGPSASDAHAKAISPLESDLAEILSVAKSPLRRERALHTATALLGGLKSRETLAILWDDVIEAARSSASVSVLWHRCELWRALGRELGHDLRTLERNVCGVLSDDATSIEFARFRLGDGDPDESVWRNPQRNANMPVDDRLALARRLVVTAQPERGTVVVWLIFDHASMSSTLLRVGPVTFFDARWVLACIDEHVEHEGFPPPELWEFRQVTGFRGLDRHAYSVLARVELQDHLVADGESAARANAQALVELAAFRAPGSSWRLRQGYVMYVDEREAGWRAFENDEPNWRLDRDRTETQLRDLARTTADRLPIGDAALRKATDSLNQLQRAAALPPLDQIPLLSRLLEVAAAICTLGEDKWYRFAAQHLRSRWTMGRVRWELYALGYDALERPLSGYGQTPAELGGLAAIRDDVVDRTRFNLTAMTSAVQSVATLYQGVGLLGVELDEMAVHLNSGESLLAWLNQHGANFDVLLARARRTRNVVLHGGPVVDDVLSSVSRFLHILCVDAFDLILLALVDGIPIAEAFKRSAQHMETVTERAREGQPPAAALFVDEPGASM